MDIKMEDVGKGPESHESVPITEAPSLPTLDGWIESLMTCKQLSEGDVQRLCDKVGTQKQENLRNHWLVAHKHFGRLHQQAREVLQEESNVQPVVSLRAHLLAAY